MSEQYIILIVQPEWDATTMSAEDWARSLAEHRAFAEAVHAAGARILDADALMPTHTTTRIAPGREGAATVFTDGPFPEVKEIVSGYYKIEAADRAQALALAAQCPTAGYLEVTPVMPTR